MNFLTCLAKVLELGAAAERKHSQWESAGHHAAMPEWADDVMELVAHPCPVSWGPQRLVVAGVDNKGMRVFLRASSVKWRIENATAMQNLVRPKLRAEAARRDESWYCRVMVPETSHEAEIRTAHGHVFVAIDEALQGSPFTDEGSGHREIVACLGMSMTVLGWLGMRHGDFASRHVLVDQRVLGIVDWELSGPGDVATDLAWWDSWAPSPDPDMTPTLVWADSPSKQVRWATSLVDQLVNDRAHTGLQVWPGRAAHLAAVAELASSFLRSDPETRRSSEGARSQVLP